MILRRASRGKNTQQIAGLDRGKKPRHAGKLRARLHLQDRRRPRGAGRRVEPERNLTMWRPNPENPGKGCIYVGRRRIKDTAPPGDYNFKTAFDPFQQFLFHQRRPATPASRTIVPLGEKFHFGETHRACRRGRKPRGDFPDVGPRFTHGWRDGDTANICIGQGEVAVTPAANGRGMISAIANGGKVLWPRLVDADRTARSGVRRSRPRIFQPAWCATNLDVHPRSLNILRDAMLADVNSSEGTGKEARGARPADLRQDRHGAGAGRAQPTTGYNYWFASFAPYENPSMPSWSWCRFPARWLASAARSARRSPTTFTRKF